METISLETPELREVLRRIILQTIDLFWVDHLEMMEYLRGSVNLRAYGQRDPVVEYKKDGLRFFRDMEVSISRQIAEFILVLNPEIITQAKVQMETPTLVADLSGESENTSASNKNVTSEFGSEKIGRNDQCPCGSGKKYKKCHGK